MSYSESTPPRAPVGGEVEMLKGPQHSPGPRGGPTPHPQLWGPQAPPLSTSLLSTGPAPRVLLPGGDPGRLRFPKSPEESARFRPPAPSISGQPLPRLMYPPGLRAPKRLYLRHQMRLSDALLKYMVITSSGLYSARGVSSPHPAVQEGSISPPRTRPWVFTDGNETVHCATLP